MENEMADLEVQTNSEERDVEFENYSLNDFLANSLDYAINCEMAEEGMFKITKYNN